MTDESTRRLPPVDGDDEIIGKTVAEIWREGYVEYDDEPHILLKMTDGSVWRFTGSYGGYTGKSQDEYISLITLGRDDHD